MYNRPGDVGTLLPAFFAGTNALPCISKHYLALLLIQGSFHIQIL